MCMHTNVERRATRFWVVAQQLPQDVVQALWTWPSQRFVPWDSLHKLKFIRGIFWIHGLQLVRSRRSQYLYDLHKLVNTIPTHKYRPTQDHLYNDATSGP